MFLSIVTTVTTVSVVTDITTVFPSLHSERKEMQSILLDDVFQLVNAWSRFLQLSNILSTGLSSSSSLGSGLEGPKVHE